jgi:phosphatidylserine/phosphatidylglycerophosphate/cardiolipin synthase-like enzyme
MTQPATVTTDHATAASPIQLADPPAHQCLVCVPLNWPAQLLHDITASNRHIVISALSFLIPTEKQKGPWPDCYQALVDAAARGVRVDVHIPPPSRSHPATARNAASAEQLHREGIKVTFHQGPRLLHAKQLILDHLVVWIGSANMTCAAFAHNHEAMCRIHSHRFASTIITRLGMKPT